MSLKSQSSSEVICDLILVNVVDDIFNDIVPFTSHFFLIYKLKFLRFLTTNFLGSTSPIRQLSTAKRIACEMQHNSSQSANIPRSHSKLCKSFFSKLWSKSRKSDYWPLKMMKILTEKSPLQNNFSKNRELHYRSEDDVRCSFGEIICPIWFGAESGKSQIREWFNLGMRLALLNLPY